MEIANSSQSVSSDVQLRMMRQKMDQDKQVAEKLLSMSEDVTRNVEVNARRAPPVNEGKGGNVDELV